MTTPLQMKQVQPICDLTAIRKAERFSALSSKLQQRISVPYIPEVSLGCGINASSQVFGKPFEDRSLTIISEQHQPSSNQKCWKAASSRESEEESRSAASMDVSGPCFEVGGGLKFAQERSKTKHIAECFIVHAYESKEKKMLERPELSETAKQLIEQRGLESFIEIYGTHYVAGFIHAASFIGMAKAEAESEASAKEIAVKAHAAISYGLYKGGAEVEHKQSHKEVDSKYSITARASIRGLEIHRAINNISSLWQAYEDFIEAAKEHNSQTPYLLICVPWIELGEFKTTKVHAGYLTLDQSVDKAIEMKIYKEMKKMISVYDYRSAAYLLELCPTLLHFAHFIQEFESNNETEHLTNFTKTLLLEQSDKLERIANHKLSAYLPKEETLHPQLEESLKDKPLDEVLATAEAMNLGGNTHQSMQAYYRVFHQSVIDKNGEQAKLCLDKIKQIDPQIKGLDNNQKLIVRMFEDIALLKQAVAPFRFGKAEWERYFGDIGVEPPLPENIEEIQTSPCPFWGGRRIAETHILVLIPASVNGSPLTWNFLKDLIQNPRGGGQATEYEAFTKDLEKEIGSRSIPSSYWALITKDVLPNSRRKTYCEQQALIKGPYEPPRALEIVTGILIHHVQTGQRLYSDNPSTGTHCQERDTRGRRVVVGGFDSSGLRLNSLDNVRDNEIGLGGVRKF